MPQTAHSDACLLHGRSLICVTEYDKRCPTCRNNVTQQRSDAAADFNELYDNGFAEQAAIVVESRLALKVDADRMRIMLRTNFGVKEQDLRHLNKRKLAACLAEQLLYETDDEDDGDGDDGDEEEDEEDEEVDDIH